MNRVLALLQGFQLVITNSGEAKAKRGRKNIFLARVAQGEKLSTSRDSHKRAKMMVLTYRSVRKTLSEILKRLLRDIQVCTNTKKTFINR